MKGDNFLLDDYLNLHIKCVMKNLSFTLNFDYENT